MFAAVAPFGAVLPFLVVTGGKRHSRTATLGSLSAFAVLVLAAALSGPFLGLLDVSAESFQFAAGAVMAPSAFRLLVTGDSMSPANARDESGSRYWLVPVAMPLLAGPASIASAVSYAARFGEATVVSASALALAGAAVVLVVAPTLERLVHPAGLHFLGRLSGALLIVVAVELAVDGVRSV
jgi:multiple antibiotic resistance protein